MALLVIFSCVRLGVRRREIGIVSAGVFVTGSALHYLKWRLETVDLACAGLSLPVLFVESIALFHAIGFQYTVWPRTLPKTHPTEDPTRRPLFILIPTVNEGVAVLEETIRAAMTARGRYQERYSHAAVTIALCNDGLVAGYAEWQEVEHLAARWKISCVTRERGGGAKAGNIEAARQKLGAVDAALIVILDADQTMMPDFLLRTVPLLADPRIGWVQTPQHYRNTENPVAAWAGRQEEVFYGAVCTGKANLNAVFICGTNMVLRAEALDEIGGFPQDSVTEDFTASLQLHGRWNSAYLPEVLVEGLGPADLAAYFSQQRRWATGVLGALLHYVLRPAGGLGLTAAQRAQYLLSGMHYLCGLRDLLLYLLAPFAFLFFGYASARTDDLSAFLWHFVPYEVCSTLSFLAVTSLSTAVCGSAIGFAAFPVYIGALVQVLTGKRLRFVVTPKERGGSAPVSLLLTHATLLFLCLVACVLIPKAIKAHELPTFLPHFCWLLHSVFMTGAVLWLGIRDYQHACCDARDFRSRKLPLDKDTKFYGT